MKWIILIPAFFFLTACGTLYTSETVHYRQVTVEPVVGVYIIEDEAAPVDVTVTRVGYY